MKNITLSADEQLITYFFWRGPSLFGHGENFAR
jgi:hypothetical protein